MPSIADLTRKATRESVQTLSPAARVELALRLGDDDRGLLAAARELDHDAAQRQIRRQRQIGRQPSRCATEPSG